MSMRMRIWVLVLMLLSASIFLDVLPRPSNANSLQANARSGQSHKKSKKIDVQKYLEMPDPKKAAEALLSDARSKNIDIDFRPEVPRTPSAAGLPSGPLVPKDEGQQFLRKVKENGVAEARHNSDIICVFQLSRQISYRELAEILSIGIRLFDTLPGYCYIAQVPDEKVADLVALPTVGWVDAYLPQYKYDPDAVTDEVQPFEIVSLIGQSQTCADDFRRLNIRFRHSRRNVYQALLAGSDLSEVANLWWVKEIYLAPRATTDQSQRQKVTPDKNAAAAPSVKFKPQDSRKLVSATSQYVSENGSGYKIGIVDGKCYSNHDDLKPRFDAIHSTPSHSDWDADYSHGTLVTGVAVGGSRTFDQQGDEWIEGVANGAEYVFLSFDWDTTDVWTEKWIEIIDSLTSLGVKISNHSYCIPDLNWLFTYGSFNAELDNIVDDDDHLLITGMKNGEAHVSSFGICKNVLTVGAIHYVDSFAGLIGHLAPYSPTGPTKDDMRLKPDLVAPGGGPGNGDATNGVVSTRNNMLAPPQYDWSNYTDISYMRAYGTSMATPHVTGVAAVFANWYENRRADRGWPELSSEIIKATLINTAIPVRGAGTDSSNGYSIVEFGYGLVNLYSSITEDSTSGETWRLRVYFDEVEISTPWSRYFYVPFVVQSGDTLLPKSLNVTLAFNDEGGKENPGPSTPTLWNELELSVNDPVGNWYSYTLPHTVTQRSPIQKLVIPNAKVSANYGGMYQSDWTVRVDFNVSRHYTQPPNPQDFAVVIDAVYGKPDLAVTTDKSDYKVRLIDTLPVTVTAHNIGGDVAAGVTVRLTGPGASAFRMVGEVGFDSSRYYVGNLVAKGSSEGKTFNLEPLQLGSHLLYAEVDGVNRSLSVTQYPRRIPIHVEVFDWYDIKGGVYTKNWYGSQKGIEGVRIRGLPEEATTDENGNYTITVESGTWLDSSFAEKNEAVFHPTTIPYNIAAGQDYVDQDFEMDVFRIDGQITIEGTTIGLEGVTVRSETNEEVDSLICSDGITDEDGNYTIWAERLWSGRIMPVPKNDYLFFKPGTIEIAPVETFLTGKNFEAKSVFEWQEDGLQVSSEVSQQYAPYAVSDGHGGAVIAWSDSRHDVGGTTFDVYAQRLKDDSRWWNDTRITTSSSMELGDRVRIVDEGSGDFVLIWTDERNGNTDIYAQKIDLDGVTSWSPGGLPVCVADHVQTNFGAISDDNGKTIILWADGRHHGDGNSYDIYAQKIDMDGNPVWQLDGVEVAGLAIADPHPAIAGDGLGGVYAVWPYGEGIILHRLHSDGTLWNAYPTGIVASNPSVYGRAPDVVSDGSNGVYLVYEDTRYHDIWCQRISSDGELLWGPDGVQVASYGEYRSPEAAPSSPDGGVLIVCYQQINSPFTERVQVFKLDESGALVGTAYVNNYTYDMSDEGYSIVSDGQAGGIACYLAQNKHELGIQRFDANLERLWTANGITVCDAGDYQRSPVLTRDEGAGVLASWVSVREPDPWMVYAMRINEDIKRFQIAGRILDEFGSGLSGMSVKMSEENPCVVERTCVTDTIGYYEFSVEPFWAGRIRPEPKGYLGYSTPWRNDYYNVRTDVVDDYTIRHQTTTWSSDGLLVTPVESDAKPPPSMLSYGASGILIAWSDSRECPQTGSDIFAHRIEESGDLIWTVNGEPLTQTTSFDQSPILVPSVGGNTIAIWRQNASLDPESQPYGLYAQKLNGLGDGQWGEPIEIVDVAYYDNPLYFGALADGGGGAYIAWSGDQEGIYAQRLDSNGNLVWTIPVEVLANPPDNNPVLLPDENNGVVVCWQETYGGGFSEIFAQHLNAAGSLLWNGGQGAVGVRHGTHIPEGMWGAISDGEGGIYVAWTECPDSPPTDYSTRVQWVNHNGERHWVTESPAYPDTGFTVVTTPEYEIYLDLAIDREVGSPGQAPASAQDSIPEITGENSGFFVLFYKSGAGLWAQNINPDTSFQDDEREWGDGGRQISSDYSYFGIPEEDRRFSGKIMDTGSELGGMSLVAWTEGMDLYAQRLGRAGFSNWNNGQGVLISSAPGYQLPMAMVSDGNEGAIVAWDEGGNVYATRVNDEIMAQLDVEISARVRYFDLDSVACYFSMPDSFALGCPQGDGFHIIVSLEISGDLMSGIPKEAITISQPKNGNVEFFDTEIADYDPVLVEGVYKTTITIEEMSGCGRDSAMVNIYDIGRGYAHINVRSPDLERNETNGLVELKDFDEFGRHYLSSLCDCDSTRRGTYDICSNFTPQPPDTVIDLSDFSAFGLHFNHAYQGGGGQASRSVVYSSGSVKLDLNENNPLNGKRTLTCSVSLRDVELYSVLFLAFKNENPIFKYLEWNPNPDYPRPTMCAEIVRDGQKQIVLGVLGSKTLQTREVFLGDFELAIHSDEPLALTSDDLALVTADLLELTGAAKVFPGSQVQRNLQPTVFKNELAQNYPNPFNPTTTIAFSIANDSDVSLRVYDVTGALVKTLVDDRRKKNKYRVIWDGKNNQGNSVASGVYFYQMKASDFKSTKKMVLLR